jgi:hypothetical protein
MSAAMQLVDADAHVNPPATFWDDYLPARFAGRGPRIEEGAPNETHDWVVFEGSRKPLNLLSTVVGQGRSFKPVGRRSDVKAGSFEPAARLGLGYGRQRPLPGQLRGLQSLARRLLQI